MSTYGFQLYCIARIIIHKRCFFKNHYEFLRWCFAQSNTFTESNQDARGQLAHLQDEKRILQKEIDGLTLCYPVCFSSCRHNLSALRQNFFPLN